VDVGNLPFGVAVTPDGSHVYVTNQVSDTVSVIETATNTVTATVGVGKRPAGVAVTPNGAFVYVGNAGTFDVVASVSVIDTATNTVTATVPVGNLPVGVAVTPDGSRIYVANAGDNTVSVIDTATNTVTATVGVGVGPEGVAVTPDGSRVDVANAGDNTVSVIDTATNTVTATVGVGSGPVAFGQFIGTPPPPNPAELIKALRRDVTKLVAGGANLPAGGQSLYAKLDAALAALAAGDTATARTKLQDFINQVNAFDRTGRLTNAQGQPLIDKANAIMAVL
jgi:YVTN family beta-propeller protein